VRLSRHQAEGHPQVLIIAREMLQVAGDNNLSTGLDRRRQHVPVAWIGELESLGEGFVPGDEAV